MKHMAASLFHVIFIKTQFSKHFAYKAWAYFFFAVFQDSFTTAVIQGAMAALAAFCLKTNNDIALLAKLLQFFEEFVAVHGSL
ncbi:MAG: hypothetical protein U9N58_08100 [Thermodesulfobacteriota bacterium]|nr:hypothetical protein [Thermodesulfobacteriota bacterium]